MPQRTKRRRGKSGLFRRYAEIGGRFSERWSWAFANVSSEISGLSAELRWSRR